VGSIKLFDLSSEGRYMRYIRDFFLLCSYSFKKSVVDLAFDLIIETSTLFYAVRLGYLSEGSVWEGMI
jgi:hypothetical protein